MSVTTCFGRLQTEPNPRIGKPYLDLADCPADGGKWAIYCEHELGTSLIQDTNKRRLSESLNYPEDWCCYCQENVELDERSAR